MEEEDTQAVADWLTPVNHAARHSTLLAQQREETGQWLLAEDKVRSWVDLSTVASATLTLTKSMGDMAASSRVLFWPGPPGAGKTMLTAVLVEHLCKQFQNKGGIGIAYFYCDYGLDSGQEPPDILASILKQLIQKRRALSDSVRRLYGEHKWDRTRPSSREVSDTLSSVAKEFSSIFILVDGLDEYELRSKSWTSTLAEIKKLRPTESPVRILATSSDIPAVSGEFKGYDSIMIRANPEDLHRYVQGRIFDLRPFVWRDADLQETIKTETVKIAGGIFLVAQMIMDSLRDKSSKAEVTEALKAFSPEGKASGTGSGVDALDLAYSQIGEKIDGQLDGLRKLAMAVMAWVTCARRPLTLPELRRAVSMKLGQKKLDTAGLPDAVDVLSVCGGLLTVVEDSEVVRFVHPTAKEYFKRNIADKFPEPEKSIAGICITCLSFDEFTGFCSSREEFDARAKHNPFYDYAAKCWGHHAR
ncbi:uncharacterized protein B0T15DRAFT_409748, partial [Chaetomium strumarium]